MLLQYLICLFKSTLHKMRYSMSLNLQEKIMATLTLFSAIFIPLSFLTGFFGMNFVHFGVLEYTHAVLLFTAMCVIIA
ncbi:MAG: magnesium and cobalt transport protein CorA, partial [Deltaproteobacteria bacterium HGW-Deltaproteobacteria-24]